MNPISYIKSFVSRKLINRQRDYAGEEEIYTHKIDTSKLNLDEINDDDSSDYSSGSLYQHPKAMSPVIVSNELPNSDIDDMEEESEATRTATKVKIGAAVLVVGFASYIAYWVQEPTDIKVAVLDNEITETATAEAAPGENDAMVAQDTENIVEISIVDFTYSPANVTVEAGTTVIWTNLDSVDHTVTGSEFDSGILGQAGSYSYEFARPGEFIYSCTLHPEMTGKISVIGEPAGAVEPEGDIEGMSDEELDNVIDSILNENEGDLDLALLAAAAEESTAEKGEMTAEETDEEKVLAVLSTASEDGEVNEASTINEEEAKEQLASTGPEDYIYLFLALLIILYTSRKKFANVFSLIT